MDDLIERARDAAAHSREFGPGTNAPLLDALAAEVEALRRELDRLRGEHVRVRRDRNAAQARAERLAEALRPLANLDLRPDGFDKRPDDQTIYARDQTAITVGHVRRAQAALRDHDGGAE